METTGCELIAKERERQINELGYDVKNDSLYSKNELASAGAVYALDVIDRGEEVEMYGEEATLLQALWPWDFKYWKPTPEDRKRELVKAGALIAAQIDRLIYEESLTNK